MCTSGCNCSSTGAIQLLTAQLEATNSTTGWCKENNFCKSPLTQQAMFYPTENLPCERAFKNAQNHIVKLCGTVNGMCCNGKCVDYMITIPTPRCDQYQGHKKEARWLFSVYIILTLILWQWSTNKDINTIYRKYKENREAASGHTHSLIPSPSYTQKTQLGSFL